MPFCRDSQVGIPEELFNTLESKYTASWEMASYGCVVWGKCMFVEFLLVCPGDASLNLSKIGLGAYITFA